MQARLNQNFLEHYLELDRACCEKFGVVAGGVTEYINRLNNARFAPGRDNVLPRLVKYRNIRNKFSHEAGALRSCTELERADVRWLRAFSRDLDRKKDPLSLYLRRARRYARRRRTRKYTLIGAAFLALVIAVAVLVLWYLSH